MDKSYSFYFSRALIGQAATCIPPHKLMEEKDLPLLCESVKNSILKLNQVNNDFIYTAKHHPESAEAKKISELIFKIDILRNTDLISQKLPSTLRLAEDFFKKIDSVKEKSIQFETLSLLQLIDKVDEKREPLENLNFWRAFAKLTKVPNELILILRVPELIAEILRQIKDITDLHPDTKKTSEMLLQSPIVENRLYDFFTCSFYLDAITRAALLMNRKEGSSFSANLHLLNFSQLKEKGLKAYDFLNRTTPFIKLSLSELFQKVKDQSLREDQLQNIWIEITNKAGISIDLIEACYELGRTKSTSLKLLILSECKKLNRETCLIDVFYDEYQRSHHLMSLERLIDCKLYIEKILQVGIKTHHTNNSFKKDLFELDFEELAERAKKAENI